MTGEEFDDPDVARCYAYRPTYPQELHEFLLTLVPGRERAVDLGCGPGKIARVLADHFREVQAIDPAGPMLATGRDADAGQHTNIAWIQSTAEEAVLPARCDLVVAAASISWMKPDVIFPRLASALQPHGMIAVIRGDEAVEPPWQQAWITLLQRWLPRMGETYDARFVERGRAYMAWMDVAGESSWKFLFQQPVDEFIDCQHSRATWTRSRMGRLRADEFDRDLREMLAPFSRAGGIEFEVRTTAVWGKPRGVPRESGARLPS